MNNQGRRMRHFNLVGLVCSLILGWSHPAPAQADTPRTRMEMGGVRIGMTEAEVMKAIQAFDPSARLSSRSVAYFPYFDGVNDLRTPDFLDQLSFRMSDGTLGVWFASPPSEPRVFAVVRRASLSRPPGSDQLLAGLQERYGPFSARSAPRGGGGAMVHWNEEGKAACASVRGKNGSLQPSPNAMGMLVPPGAVKVLERLARQDALRGALGPSRDPVRCGTVLRYEWLNEPVGHFEAWLVDQGGMVAADRQSAQWVEQLTAEARRKVSRQGTTPKF